jgi:hypothetical protein
MLLIHPVVQMAGIILLLAAFVYGVQRFRSLHLNQKVPFLWKRHVLLGEAALGTLIVGTGIGLVMTRYHWGEFLMTLGHGKTGLVILPMLLFGLISGLILDKKKPRGKTLKVLHGLNNTLILILSLNQIRTGIKIYLMFTAGL